MKRNPPSRLRVGVQAALLALAAFGPLGMTGCGSIGAAPGRAEIDQAVEAVYPALVRIHVVTERGGDGRMEKFRATGSGTIISPDGYIVTNHHVAGRATRITVRLVNREELDAELIGTDPLSDLAVLKIDPASRRDPSKPLPCASFGDSDQLAVGDIVLAMGSPAGLSQSVTRGIVANTAMISPSGGLTLDGESVGELVRWIGHDAVIYPGNSGGPLVNLRGEVIGVNEVGIGSLGGAIPSNLARSVTREIIEKREVSRSWIGLEVQPLLKKMGDEKGVLVSTVLPDSPAQAAGLKPGDFITEFSGQPVVDSRAAEDIPIFNRMVFALPAGAKATLKGRRDGKETTWEVTTVLREPKLARESQLKSWGITARNISRIYKLENQLDGTDGVLVDSLRSGGPASEAKPALRRGDIIVRVDGKPVTSIKSLEDITAEATRGLAEPRPVLVSVDRDAQELLTVVKLGPEPQDEKAARPTKAWLGVQTQVLTRELSEAMKLDRKKGVRVTQVVPGSPAEKAGVKVGDVFFKIDGEEVAASTPSDQELFENLIRVYKVGTEAQFEGLRDGQPLKLAVKLGAQPKLSSEYNEYKDDRFEFTVRDVSLLERVDEKLAENARGVRIVAVQPSGWAALAGVGSGDILLAIDGKSVGTAGEVKAMLEAFRQSRPRRVVFFVKRGVYTYFAEVEPRW